MHKKNYKNAANEVLNNEKKNGFLDFQVRKASSGQSNTGNRFFEKFYIDNIFLKFFFYRSKPLVAKNAKESFCSKKMSMKSKTGVDSQKNFFLR